MAKLLTGYTGVNIFAADDQDLYKGIVGKENFVFNVGGKLELTVNASPSAVTATIADGVFSFNGRIVRSKTPEDLPMTYADGGYRRCIVVARYTVDNITHTESVDFQAVCSVQSSADPIQAANLAVDVYERDYIDGSTPADFSLYSFVYSSSGIYGNSKTTHFDIVNGVGNLQDQSDRIDSLDYQISNTNEALENETSDRNDADSALDDRISAIENNITSSSTLLFGGSAAPKNKDGQGGDTITLSESFEHFRQLLFVDGNHGICLVVVGEETKFNVNETGTTLYVGATIGVTTTATFKWSNQYTLYNDISRYIVIAESATRLRLGYGSRIQIGTSISAPENLANIVRIYGMNRIMQNAI